jgi:hypothetical protein
MTYIGRWSVDYEKAVVLGKGKNASNTMLLGLRLREASPIRVVLCDSWQEVLN